MATLKDSVVSGSLRVTDTLYSTTAQFQILRAPTAPNGTTYGPGSANNLLKSNGTSVYWTTLLASDIPNLSTDKLTSGTLPVERGGTGQTTIANIWAGKDGNGNTISSTYLKLSGGILTGILNITPATGEGGELHLNAATSEVTKNSIVLDNYYGAFRIFGGASADGTTRTGVGTPLIIDPYDKTITGGYNFDGNSNTATKFASAQTISLTGDITGSASSTGGWSIATTIGAGKVTNAMLANSSIKVGNATISLGNTDENLHDILRSSTNINKTASWDIYSPGVYYVAVSSGESFEGTNGPENDNTLNGITPYHWGQLIVSRAGRGGVAQFYISDNDSANSSYGIHYRTGWDNTYKNKWSVLLDSSNYTNWTVTKTGGGASGTWEISITGNSGMVRYQNNNLTFSKTNFNISENWERNMCWFGDSSGNGIGRVNFIAKTNGTTQISLQARAWNTTDNAFGGFLGISVIGNRDNTVSYTVNTPINFRNAIGASSGVWPVSLGGTGQTAIANIQAGKDGDGNTISSTYLKLSGGTLTGNLTISHATNATMTADSTNPKITFSENGSQPVHLIYTDYDNYRNPAGLKVIGGASANPAWFEVEGQIYTSGGTFKNIATSSNTSLYVRTNQNNGGVELRADGEGGNLKITGPDGTSYFEIDASNNTHLRVYSYSDFSNTSTYKTINWDRTSGNLLNNDGIIYAGNTSLTKEIQLRARSAAGEVYLFTQGSATGSKGIYSYNASGTGGGILIINQSNQISSLADINTNINVVNGGIIIGTMDDTVQRSINIRSKTGRVVLYTGVSYKGFYATSAPTTDAPNGIGKDIIRINNDNDVDSLAYFKVPVQIKGLNSYASTPSSDLTTDLIQMYDSNLSIYHRIYSAMGTGGTKTLFMMTREPGSELKTYVQFGVRLNSDGSPGFTLSAKNNGTETNTAARVAFRNMLGASSGTWPIGLGGTAATTAKGARNNLSSAYTYDFTGGQSKATIIDKLNTELSAGEVAVVCLTTTSMRNLTGSTTIGGYFKGTVVKETSMLDFFLGGVSILYLFRINISTQAISDAKSITLNNWTIS